MKRPKLKWVPDVHRPETDFTAEHKSGIKFQVMTYNGVGVLTVKIPLPGKMGTKRWLVEETRYAAHGQGKAQMAMDAAEEYIQ
jgi:hypothetical protein